MPTSRLSSTATLSRFTSCPGTCWNCRACKAGMRPLCVSSQHSRYEKHLYLRSEPPLRGVNYTLIICRRPGRQKGPFRGCSYMALVICLLKYIDEEQHLFKCGFASLSLLWVCAYARCKNGAQLPNVHAARRQAALPPHTQFLTSGLQRLSNPASHAATSSCCAPISSCRCPASLFCEAASFLPAPSRKAVRPQGALLLDPFCIHE